MRIAFFLLAFPFFVIVYFLVFENISLTGTIIIFFPLALFSILIGFSLLRRSSDQLVHLSIETGKALSGINSNVVSNMTDRELKDIAEHFNCLFKKFSELSKETREQSIQLMLYAVDLSKTHKTFKDETELRNRLARYLRSDLVEKLIHSKSGIFPENERKEVAVLFADIRAFTTLSEIMAPDEVVSMLNEYFSVMVDIIFKNDGILDKFIGDQIMAIFGLLPSKNNGSCNALQAAIEMQGANADLMEIRSQRGDRTFAIGIGIHTGNAIVGNIGSDNRMDYTVIGDTVNTAARLQAVAKGGEIVIGEQTFSEVPGLFQVQKKLEIWVKNKTKPVTCYKVNPASNPRGI